MSFSFKRKRHSYFKFNWVLNHLYFFIINSEVHTYTDESERKGAINTRIDQNQDMIVKDVQEVVEVERHRAQHPKMVVLDNVKITIQR